MDEAGMSLRAGLGFAFQAAVQIYIDFNQPGEISPMLDPRAWCSVCQEQAGGPGSL